MDGAMPAHAPAPPVALEQDVPLSQSLLWRRQRDYYARRGVKAWSDDNVPTFITSNPFFTEIYARIVAGFFDDSAAMESPHLSPEHPLRVLELGAGTGKFSYLFLRHLSALLVERGIAPAAVRYCMTDCSESLPAAWRANPQLAEFVEAGILDFAVLTAGEEIKSPFVSGEDRGPLVVIANYVLDSLPLDAFVIQDRRLLESLVTTLSGGSEAEPLKSLELSYKNVEVARQRYADPSWNHILELYRDRLPAATVLFPSTALATLNQIAGFSGGRLLVLAADKGCVHESELELAQGPPFLEWHAGGNCFSTMVNFDAIGKYFAAAGGQALLPAKHSASLNVCAFLQGHKGDRFPATAKAYHDAQEAFGTEDLFALLGWLNAHMEEMLVPQILAVLRLSRWDPTAFMRIFPVLGRQLRSVAAGRHDIRDAVLRTWTNHYPVHPSENVLAFQCGVTLLELRFFAEAQDMFRISQRVLGPSAATSYNLGLCFQGLERPGEALACMVEACELDPQFEPARSSRQKLEQQVKDNPA
jgi:tetratricopeptide (TPR) repeat protein